MNRQLIMTKQKILSECTTDKPFYNAQENINEMKKIFSLLDKNIKTINAPSYCTLVNFSNCNKIPINRWFKYREGFSTDLINKGMVVSQGYFNAIPGPLNTPFLIYAALYVVYGIYLCYKYYIGPITSKEKKQARLILIATIIPTIGGIITQVILPIVGLSEIRLTTTLTTIMVLALTLTLHYTVNLSY